MNNYIYKSKNKIKGEIIAVLIATIILLSLLWYKNLDFIYLIIILICILQILFIQKKTFILTTNEFIVMYPLIKWLIKPKKFNLDSVKKFYFGSNNAAYSTQTFRIYMKNGDKFRYSYLGYPQDQELIDLLREKGFEVEVNSHWWK